MLAGRLAGFWQKTRRLTAHPAAVTDKQAGRFLRTDKDIHRTLCRCSGEQAGRFLAKDKETHHTPPPLPEINGPADSCEQTRIFAAHSVAAAANRLAGFWQKTRRLTAHPAAVTDKQAGRFLLTDKDIRCTLCLRSGEQAGRFLVKDKGIRHPLPPLPEINGPVDFANRQEVN